jgi:hypothetical protein
MNYSTVDNIQIINIESAKFMSPDFERILNWNDDIIGFNIDHANIEVTARPVNGSSSHPSRIHIEVIRRPPKDPDGILSIDSADKSAVSISLDHHPDPSRPELINYL